MKGGGTWLNTLLANNTAAGGGPNLSGIVVSLGFNLVAKSSGGAGFNAHDLLNVNPLLGPLTNNGGPTLTCALTAGSPANNAGTSNGAPRFDQRGIPRSTSGRVDIGAYEFIGTPPILSALPDQNILEDAAPQPIHFIVDDIEAEVARLRAAGATFRNDIVSGPGGKQILLEDPSGNVVELFQPAAR